MRPSIRAPGSPVFFPWARAAVSARTPSWRTQFSGLAHKSLPDHTSAIVLSAPIEKQKATSVTSTSRTTRTDQLLRQTRIHFPRFEEAKVKIIPIENGGSDRKFYRVRCAPEQAIILVKYGFEREENRHYVKIAEFLAEHRIRAPRIYFHDPAEGLIWIEDLGENDLWSYREESWLVRRALYESALDEIVKLHCLPEEAGRAIQKNLPVAFDAALYRWEQNYFFKNCLGGHFGVDEKKLSELTALPGLEQIAARLGDLPRVMVHRDFQSQNIIIRDAKAHLIDFQGMRPGLAEYDLAAVIFSSALPTIIWRESGHARSFWLALIQCAVLIIAAIGVLPFPRLRVLTRFLLALAVLRLGWYVVAPWLEATGFVHSWLVSANWGERLLIDRTVALAGAILMSLTLIGSGITRGDLFLRRGDLAASAQPIPFLWPRNPIPWTIFGPVWLVVFGIALPLFLYFTVHPAFSAGARIVHFAPWILGVAALNPANEEF